MKKVISGIFCHFLYHVKYINLNKLEKNEKCLICPSHSNIFDPTFIYPKTKNLFIMGKSEIFRNKLIAKILTHYQVFPVHREKRDVKSTLYAMNILTQGKNRKLLIFPEGGILKNEEAGKNIKNGAVFLASETNTPIIPVYITRHPKIFHRVYVIFGDAINIEKGISKQEIKEKSQELLKKIYKLEEQI